MATIIGTNGNDVRNGTASTDTIVGRAGNDRLSGLGGNDRLNGGTNNDRLDGGTGTDTADYSNIFLGGTIGTTYIGATAGVNVHLDLSGEQDTGGAGRDTLVSIENLIGTNFNDRLTGNGGSNLLSGLNGNDILVGNGGADQLFGGNGNEFLNGGLGDDILNGGTGTDWADYSTGTDKGRAFEGALGSVVIDLNLGFQDTFGSGFDTLVGIENVLGTNFGDDLIGNGGNNVLFGSGGNDFLIGGGGNDTLNGGSGADSLTSGSGINTFVYRAVSDSESGGGDRDTIEDFFSSSDDIDLRGIDADSTVSGNQAFAYIDDLPFLSFLPGELRYDNVTGILQGNTDNDAAAEFEVLLAGAPSLFVSDLLL